MAYNARGAAVPTRYNAAGRPPRYNAPAVGADPGEEPLLLRAACWGHASICEALLAAGADASATRNTYPHAEGMRGDSMETAVANGRVAPG